MKTIIKAKNLYSDGMHLINQKIEVENNQIVSLQTIDNSEVFDFENIAPALVDIHINGGEYFHFTQSPSFEALKDIEASALKNGTGYVLPTLISCSIEKLFESIKIAKDFLAQNPSTGVLGLHLEGPFLNPKKRGAHLEKYLIKPTDALIDAIISKSEGCVKMITLAPELFTDAQLQKFIDSDITVSVGHSDPTFEQAQHAFSLGIRLVTHLYNAMSVFSHRAPGLVGAALLNPTVFTPIILDNIHVSPGAAQVAYKTKNEKLFLISDALFQNYKKQTFEWEEFNAKLQNSKYINDEGNLAGGTLSLAEIVQNSCKVLEIPLEKAIEMATVLPLKALNLDRKIGKIEVGYEAKFYTF